MLFTRTLFFNIKKSGLALTVASFPGLQKLALITFIMKFYGSHAAGLYATLTALPIFISLFTGVGFGGKLLKILPGEPSLKQKNNFSRVAVASVLYAFFSGVVFFVLSFLDIVQQPFIMFLYLLCITVVQLIRHYYLATLNYFSLFLFDVTQLALLTIPVFFISDINTYIVMSSLVVLVFSTFWYLKVIALFNFSVVFLYDKETVQFSVNNILSGGVLALMPLVLARFYGEAIVGEVFAIISFFSLFLLLPRAFSNYKIPVLVGLVKHKVTSFYIGATSFQKQYVMLTVLCLFISFIVSFIAMYFKIANVLNITLIGTVEMLAIVLFVFSGSFGVVQGVILFVLGKQKYNIYSNIIFFIVYFIFVVCAYQIQSVSISVFFIISSLISFARLPYLFFYSKKAIQKTKELTC